MLYFFTLNHNNPISFYLNHFLYHFFFLIKFYFSSINFSCLFLFLNSIVMLLLFSNIHFFFKPILFIIIKRFVYFFQIFFKHINHIISIFYIFLSILKISFSLFKYVFLFFKIFIIIILNQNS